MPVAPPKHCPKPGHPAFTGRNCPLCQATYKARHDARRPSARARGYDTAWDKARKSFLERNPRCCFCGAPATVVDHKVPHRGDRARFWDKSQWQGLCAPCHSGAKQREESRGGRPRA